MKRNGGDKRGSSADRRRRKTWMLAYYGDGTHVDCVHCGRELTFTTVEADRIIPGGSYARVNVQPSCAPCNMLRGDSPITPFRPRITAGR